MRIKSKSFVVGTACAAALALAAALPCAADTHSATMISSIGVSSVNESVSKSSATTGNLFRYESTSDQYLFNWSTKGLSPGAYRLFIDLGDGVERTVELGLR